MLEMDCFDFRVINLPNGDQVIDKAIRTPYEALEPLQMLEYTEMEREMAVMDQMRRKEKRELKRRRRNSRNPLYRLACICGLGLMSAWRKIRWKMEFIEHKKSGAASLPQ